MKKVFLFSLLLVFGLMGSQFFPLWFPEDYGNYQQPIRVLTMFCLSFIMIHVGYEFELDKKNLKQYLVDYGVAATAAAFPWILCAVYFVLIIKGPGAFRDHSAWKESLLTARFAAPTSAGILFSMLAAAGLAGTWVFRKARVLAIFDDLDTILLMIPLKIMMVGFRWQLVVMVMLMFTLLWVAWKYLHRLAIPVSWLWVMGYSAIITVLCELVYWVSKIINDVLPLHIEVLLPAFVLGCILARPSGHDPHVDDMREGHQEGLETSEEQRISTWISGIFMILVGLSLPSMGNIQDGESNLTWGSIMFHVLLITLLANLGKMFPLFCYRREASWRERLAMCIGMWPRGEVGAGVLVVSLSYGIGGAMVTVAMLSLALNLLLTGIFIYFTKRLLINTPSMVRFSEL